MSARRFFFPILNADASVLLTQKLKIDMLGERMRSVFGPKRASNGPPDLVWHDK